MVRSWDADSYHVVSGPMVDMAREVLDRLPLRGDETVLDAGCGTGLATSLLIDRLPAGRVIAVDADPAMVAKAREHLGGRAEVRQADLLQLELSEPVDAVYSTATFHWIPDHETLFARLFVALRPGGRLVAQCGGEGNLDRLRAAEDRVIARKPYSDRLTRRSDRLTFPTVERTTDLLTRAGFEQVECSIRARTVTPDDPFTYLRTINLGSTVQALPAGLADAFVNDVIDELGSPVEIDYVRLDMDAVRPA